MFNAIRIRELIDENNLTNKDFCSKVGISVQTLSDIEAGSAPRVTTLEKIADFFGISMDYFFDRNFKNVTQIGHTLNGNGSHINGDIVLDKCRLEVEHLRELLTEKERTIQLLLSINEVKKDANL